MKICNNCFIFFQEQVMSCQRCGGAVEEVSLNKALQMTRQKAFKKRIGGETTRELPDAYKQYHVRSYLKDRSLFLDYGLHKNRLKHGRRLKRFFIAPISLMSVLNLPWFLFNVITSNLFHLEYTGYCPHCNTKYIPGRHDQKECDYNIEFFSILDDILSGRIVVTKAIYEQFAMEKKAQGIRSAHEDLFSRRVRWEAFWDVVSIGFSIILWLYIAVYLSYPMFKVLLQKLQQLDAYEWSFLSLR